MKISLVQMNTQLGNIDNNLTTHLSYINKAILEKSDLIVFPELALTGYMLQDLVPSVSIIPSKTNPIFNALLEQSQSIDIVTSFVERDAKHRYFISAVYLSKGEILHLHRKIYLPTYGLFDEGRYFSAGKTIEAFDTPFGRIGMLICEDFWHASLPYLLWLDGADIMIFLSASPGRGLTESPLLESSQWVNHITQAYSSLFTSFVASTNRVGYEDGVSFYGLASVHDPNGSRILEGPQNVETMVSVEMDLSQLQRTRTKLPLLRDENPEITLSNLQRILKK
jgi:NAD+ synthase (glutamine-hydrolysing)